MTQASKKACADCPGAAPADVLGVLEQQFRIFAINLGKFKQESSDNRLDRLALIILGTLSNHGPSRLSAVADKCGFDQSTASRQVSALEQAGLLERTTDPDDRRAVVLKASPKGKRLLQRLEIGRRKRLERLLNGWTAEEIATFTTLLGRLNESTERHHEEHLRELEQELNHG
ncbi:MAG TPA: MarR family transcriptional regulator [Jatrophihabitans sp.]|nr:MarR family transcriptional regulator [Jatrophihabitans sp.]